jgi:hypothetical protein
MWLEPLGDHPRCRVDRGRRLLRPTPQPHAEVERSKIGKARPNRLLEVAVALADHHDPKSHSPDRAERRAFRSRGPGTMEPSDNTIHSC